nr:MAG: hypothetical protein SLSPV1s3_gp1 [Sanya lschnura senegalensis phenuivirus 1]
MSSKSGAETSDESDQGADSSGGEKPSSKNWLSSFLPDMDPATKTGARPKGSASTSRDDEAAGSSSGQKPSVPPKKLGRDQPPSGGDPSGTGPDDSEDGDPPTHIQNAAGRHLGFIGQDFDVYFANLMTMGLRDSAREEIMNIQGMKGVREIVKVIESMQYQGFNAKTVLLEILRHYRNLKENAIRPFTIGGLEVKHKDLTRDSQLVCLLFCQRGTKLNKIKTRATTDLEALVDHLKMAFHIQDSAPKNPKDITMARFAACHPNIVCEMYHLGLGRPLISLNQVRLSENLSMACLSNLFPSVCPLEDKDGNSCIDVLLRIAKEIDKVINTRPTEVEKIRGYVLAANQSPLVPRSLRVKLMEKWGFMESERWVADFR